MEPLIVNRDHAAPDHHTARWRVSCPHGLAAPVRFSFSEMHTDEGIVQAARAAVSLAKHPEDPAHAREIVMGSRFPAD